ncbi:MULTISPECIES: DUF1028 domain-containing protein [Halomonas]|uniref:DUF1028 domain-containing protein n=1 Tax=Halomonas TaxID=2745 RepID=UPI001C94D8E8|nr:MULTISPECIES: DUF1028 domain-containing protein [Halomonas]MBY5926849.1 DUF1028 domain-containing protein [Halomonas sp. DP4Y7-2]MBY5970204.1 DUF1028 domain-containing protein [Halomonas denitrificans]MBY6233891.1 DUF1028 domain-containing protein [Halomonas sp. DP4Y7-1]MED5294256.1 DUF1028 domain-containing protein [Pseudomonadota bacterium]
MTLSLLHVNPDTGTVAALTATGGVAVGGYVHHAWRGIGACATQGRVTHPWYPEGIRQALADDVRAQQALDDQVVQDPQATLRQCLVMDRYGTSALHNGADNGAVVASCHYPGVAAAGNLLADRRVVNALCDTLLSSSCRNAGAVIAAGAMPVYRADYERCLPESLVDALEAALGCGGDVRGTRSAALRVESFHQAPIDLRIDWCEGDLVGELRGLIRRVRESTFADFLAAMPRR